MSSAQDHRTLPSWRGLLSIAPDLLDQFMAKKPVQFLVGHDRVEFAIHPDLLSRLSAPLTALVNEETKESLELCVVCEDIDKDVFSRFVQFLYTGAYVGFPPAEIDRPARRVRKVSGITASVDQKLPDNSIQNAPISLWSNPSFPRSTNMAWHESIVKDRWGRTGLFGAFQENDNGRLFKLPYSLASYNKAVMERPDGLFGTGTLPLFCAQHRPDWPGYSKRKFDSTTCYCHPYQKKRPLISEFLDKYGGTDDKRIPWKTTPTPETMFSDIIGHARIWVFANKFAIASLMDLSFSQLALEHGKD